jgi:VanZ family protein
VVIAIITLLFQMKNDSSSLPTDIFGALILLAFVTVGALIASQRPQNPIGWIFCAGALLSTLGTLLLEYTTYAFLTAPGSLPAGALIGVFGGWARSIGWFLVLTYLLLLFPNGHLPSPRWRFLAWLIVGLLVVYSIAALLSPYPYANIDPSMANIRNPMGILVANDLFDQLANFILVLSFPIILACIVSVILRFRRAQGAERQQLKWFSYGMTLSLLMILIIFILIFTTTNGGSGILFYLALVCMPISAGIAILRYRLYDIDVLINRTLIYGILTAVLALAYVICVLVLQYLLSGFTGGSQLAIVGSTLVIAALFQPLRRRIQKTIDRRFYRTKYDSSRALEAFSVTLRNEVDLQELSEHLVKIVQETMHPAHVSLWLRPPEQAGKYPATWTPTSLDSSQVE